MEKTAPLPAAAEVVLLIMTVSGEKVTARLAAAMGAQLTERQQITELLIPAVEAAAKQAVHQAVPQETADPELFL